MKAVAPKQIFRSNEQIAHLRRQSDTLYPDLVVIAYDFVVCSALSDIALEMHTHTIYLIRTNFFLFASRFDFGFGFRFKLLVTFPVTTNAFNKNKKTTTMTTEKKMYEEMVNRKM